MNNNIQQALNRLNDVIQNGVTGAIVLPTNPSLDAAAAAAALYLGLHKMGKSVSLACSNKISYNLTAVDKIQTQLSTDGDNLVISFPYSDGAIDKVDYNIQGSNFNLIITPRQGFPKLEPSQVKYNYTGGDLDLVLVIDSPTLNSLGTLYSENEKQFQGKDIINIDRHLTNSYYGSVNYVNKTSSSLSEMVLKLLQNLGIEIDRDMATNLYSGIAASTNNFTSYSVTADTFESVAALLRLGAIKRTLTKPVSTRGFQSPRPMGTAFSSAPSVSPLDNMTPIETVEKEPKGTPASAPQDWLKPKIFRGGGGLV